MANDVTDDDTRAQAAQPEEDQPERWSYPDITDPSLANDTRTNALNKPLKYRYEPPEADDQPDDDSPAPLTAEQLEEIRQAARDEGFQEGLLEGREAGQKEGYAAGFEEAREAGHAEGYSAGEEAGREQMLKLTADWQTLLENTYAPLQAVDQQVEQQLVEMVMELSRAICLHEVTQSAESIRQAVNNGIQALPLTEQRVLIKLHPDDVERVQAAFGQDVIEQRGWNFSKDEHMEPGGCEITTETSTVDMSLRKRMQTVFQQLLDAEQDTDTDAPADEH